MWSLLQKPSGKSSRLGYRSVRAVHGVHKGYFLFEVTVASLGETGAVRVGVQTQWADLHGPVGMDQHGYGVCSTTGNAVHDSVPKQMGGRFGEGDVVGVAVFLPETNAPRTRHKEAVTWGGKLYWTQEPPAEEHAPEQLMEVYQTFTAHEQALSDYLKLAREGQDGAHVLEDYINRVGPQAP